MNVPPGTLEILQCGVCETQLSRSPVYLQQNGEGLCGVCFTPESTAIRNIHYEALAKFATFPCKYKELGCVETVPFVNNDKAIPHEELCEHRQWVCPVLGTAHCDWLGTKANLLQHCQDQHPNHVLQNRCTLEHDIITSNENTYLLRWFHELFLLHVKESLATGKLYHSVRYLGSSDKAKDFIYNFHIKRNDESISKKGEVTPQGCLTNEHTLDINSLLSVLGGFNGTTFTVEVQRRVHNEVVEAPVYRDKNDWPCMNEHKTCSYQDIYCKCTKHQNYFCEESAYCQVCDSDGVASLSAHYASECRPVCKIGSTWRPTREENWCFVPGAAGTAVCNYELNDEWFELDVYIPMSSERLREFRCEVCVTQPATGQVRIYKPDIEYNEEYDWHIKVEEADFPSWDEPFDVYVDITNI